MEYQVGNKAVIRSGHSWGVPYCIGTVTKVTKTQVEIDGKDKFMIGSGRKVGGVSQIYSDRLVSVSIEEAENTNMEVNLERKRKEKVRFLTDTSYQNWNRLDNAQLDSVIEMLGPATPAPAR